MKIMILNSGYARRLKPLTDSTHKSLLLVQNKTILERQIEHFKKLGFTNFIITTGPFEDQIITHNQKKFPEINFTYVNNPKFETTNYIYSMWLTRDLIDDDIILLHGDLVFEEKVAQTIISQKKSGVIIEENAPLPEKDFKGEIIDGKIKKIGLEVFGDHAKFLLPLYYWKKEDFLSWMHYIDEFIQNGQDNCYAENAFNEYSNEIDLYPVYIGNKFCMEIDTQADLEEAEKKVANLKI